MAEKIIKVKNTDDFHDTIAKIIISNNINFIPKISVIIPVYNSEQYLRECLDSIVNQSLYEIEIICVDDGSTDNSLNILKEFAAKDCRITVIKQENLYAGIARNAGIAIAKGEYISILDSDDWFELSMYEKMYNAALERECDVVICGFNEFDQTKHVVTSKQGFCKQFCELLIIPEEYSDKLFQITNPAIWNKLFKTSFINKFNLKCSYTKSTNDLNFTYTALYSAKSIYCINEYFINYRINSENSISLKRAKFINDWIYNLTKLKKDLIDKNLFNTFKKTYEQCVIGCGLYEYSQFKDKKDPNIKILKKGIKKLVSIKNYIKFVFKILKE